MCVGVIKDLFCAYEKPNKREYLFDYDSNVTPIGSERPSIYEYVSHGQFIQSLLAQDLSGILKRTFLMERKKKAKARFETHS